MASVCAPFGIHLEPINKELILLHVGDNVIIINCATGPKRELCSAKKKEALWANGVPYELIKNTVKHTLCIYS